MTATQVQARRRAVVDGKIVRLPRRLGGSGGEPAANPLEAALAPRVEAATVTASVRQAREYLHAEIEAIQAYQGGLPLELVSAKQRKELAIKTARHEARRAVLSRRGRRIDLPALLRQRRTDGTPVWCVRDPLNTGATEGQIYHDGTVLIGGCWRRLYPERDGNPKIDYRPVGGIPPLPAEARVLATDKHVRKHAAWVALLYQPEEWQQVDPDPAIVVEWKDRPGEYYALCVWGGDGAAIMEFVD